MARHIGIQFFVKQFSSFRILARFLFIGTLACSGVGEPTTPAVAANVTVTLPSTTLEIGSSATATAKVFDAYNTQINGKTVTWSSDNQAIATVTASGSVTGVANGTANIIATVDGKQGQAQETVVTSSTWLRDAAIFSTADFGDAIGALADVTVARLNDGRYRMFLGAIPGGFAYMYSAISTDGVKFTLEGGTRITTVEPSPGFNISVGHPFVMRLDDGRLRMFGHNSPVPSGAMAIYSLVSTDEGLTWTLEPGTRLTGEEAGISVFAGAELAKMKSGGWRMYFSTSNTSAPGTPSTDLVMSAFSTDLLKWTMDAGVRIGQGAPTLTGSAVHPAVIANDDGSVTLVYFRAPGAASGMYQATSADGLTFTTETYTGFKTAFDPFLLRLSNGDVRMYYNDADGNDGAIVTAHRSAFSLTGK